eukprot:CAMPEP_0168286828 /NCGR_PEP_ID=MMETSP0142_2-20121227/1606_1 /TAXON_ID=44445 /ORGANISM="Pseudo-nitzschia australis, Strain 10249 10 AB" /LENGTH=75 /DNA_ID=CAMNT_0008231805 /DNA_START=1 /DNA_END=225 /DNA_ORIENTATION=+
MGINVSIAPRIQSTARKHIGSKKVRQKSSTWKMGGSSKVWIFTEKVAEHSCLAFEIYWICMALVETGAMGINVSI